MTELRPLDAYLETMRTVYPRLVGPFGFFEDQARRARRMDFHKRAIDALVELTSDQARARQIWNRWGHRALPLRDQRRMYRNQLVAAKLVTRQEAASVDLVYIEPKTGNGEGDNGTRTE